MLSGLQNDWITAQNGTITLRDIPSGTYQLQVRARFHNQPWSSEIAEFTIMFGLRSGFHGGLSCAIPYSFWR